jgi:hypothetical protein
VPLYAPGRIYWLVGSGRGGGEGYYGGRTRRVAALPPAAGGSARLARFSTMPAPFSLRRLTTAGAAATPSQPQRPIDEDLPEDQHSFQLVDTGCGGRLWGWGSQEGPCSAGLLSTCAAGICFAAWPCLLAAPILPLPPHPTPRPLPHPRHPLPAHRAARHVRVRPLPPQRARRAARRARAPQEPGASRGRRRRRRAGVRAPWALLWLIARPDRPCYQAPLVRRPLLKQTANVTNALPCRSTGAPARLPPGPGSPAPHSAAPWGWVPRRMAGGRGWGGTDGGAAPAAGGWGSAGRGARCASRRGRRVGGQGPGVSKQGAGGKVAEGPGQDAPPPRERGRKPRPRAPRGKGAS